MEDAELVRQKRLARLGQSTTPTSPQRQPENSTPAKKPLVPLPALEDPVVAPAKKSPSTIRKTDSAVKSEQPSQPIPKSPEPRLSAAARFASLTDEQWECSICESVLGVSLENKPSLMYLGSVVEELKAEGMPVIAVSSNWERILYSRITMAENAAPEYPAIFDYLAGVWQKIHTKYVNLQGLASDPNYGQVAQRRIAKLNEFASLVMNYVGLAINPDTFDMFPQNHSLGAGIFGHRLCTTAGADPEQAYSRVFVDAMISRFQDEGILGIFAATVKSILTQMRSKRIYDDYMCCFRAMGYLLSFKYFVDQITLLPEWNPSFASGRSIETLSILGPFFSRTSIFPDCDPGLGARYFGSNGLNEGLVDSENGGFGERNHGDVKSAQMALRDIGCLIQANLHQLILTMIKSGPVAKENVLQYFATVIRLNEKRGQLQVNRAEVATDGFMHNILQVCKKLCEPLLDPNYSKLHLIDSTYFFHTKRFVLGDETRINADKDTVTHLESQWIAENPSSQPSNFVTDIFFITLAYHHYGLLSTMRYYKNFIKELGEMQNQGARHQAARDSGGWDAFDPVTRANHDQGLQRFLGELDKLIGVRLSMEAGLFEAPMLEQTLRFYNLVMLWVVKVATGANSNIQWSRFAQGESFGLPVFPLPEQKSNIFIMLPEWIIDDICEFYSFIMRYKAPLLEHNPRDEFMTFSMIMLFNSPYIKNPYLKSKMIEILFTFTLPLWRTATGETRGRLDGPFITHPFAKEHLVRSVLSFYVEVEQTGMHSQFYDKFNIRYNISQILKAIWTDVGHRSKIVQLSRDHDFFVKFVNLLMNDTTFLLDESLSKLKEIGTLQQELAVPLTSDNQQDRQHRQEREATLAQNERQAESYMSLGNETVHMLSILTGHPDIVEPFMANEIVGRLAAMLDFNLVVLVGPRSTELKVKNPEKYRFDPKRLLGELVDIFLHLSHRPEFVNAVAKDGRSYDPKIFHNAAAILSSRALKSADEINRLLEFVAQVDKAIKSDVAEEEELGDVPDEFLDPLLYTLMEEPVILPSNISVDLSTIRAHLLSDQHDPFNRQPLKIEDVVPNVELKAKIQAWKLSKR